MTRLTIIRTILSLLLLAAGGLRAGAPVYVALWFDTEDYIEPTADDAALRIAHDLTELGVRATFKVVGEKARVLEQRGRWDVVRALALHDIGYHSNFHSVQPTPALYLRDLGYVEGAAEFERREGPGALDLARSQSEAPPARPRQRWPGSRRGTTWDTIKACSCERAFPPTTSPASWSGPETFSGEPGQGR
jgi:hypothetical protein